MSIKSFRNIVAGLVVFSLLGIAVFAFGERVLPETLFKLFTAEASAAAADPQSDTAPETTNPEDSAPKIPVRKLMGSLNDGILFGNGDIPLGFPSRRDKIYTLGQVGEPIEISGVNDFEPSWSPNGEKIVFISLRDGPTTGNYSTRQQYREIYTMNSNGTDQTRLGGPLFGGESQPAFSPHPLPDRKIIYVADYGPGGGPSGIYTMTTFGDDQTQINTDNCFGPDDLTNPTRSKGARNTEANLYPGIYGFDTPNYSPDGNHIIFGYPGDNGVDVYRIEPSGANCTRIYEGQSNSQVAATARYSRDGTRIALYHRDGNNQTHNLRIIDAANGNILEDLQPQNFMGSPVWNPDGGDQIVYIGGDQNPDGETLNLQIWVVDLISQVADPIFLQNVAEGIRGLDWGVPTTEVPELSIRINAPNPLTSGMSTTGTIYLSSPAPAGRTTLELQSLGDLGPPPAMTVPPTLFIPAGQVQADFPITSSVSTFARSADILATRPSPNYAYSLATVTLSPSRPDLRAVSFTAVPEISPGVPFNMSWTVDNIGPVVTTPNGGIDSVFFSLDNVLSTDTDPEIVSLGNVALAAGSSRTRNTTASIPGPIVPGPGQYYLIFRTNPYESVNEGGQVANNSIAVPIQVNLADIVIENITAPAVIEPGVQYNITWNIRNAGSAPSGSATFRNYFYFSPDNIAGNADDLQLYVEGDFANIVAGASVLQSANVTIPTVPVRPTGPAFFYVKADAESRIYEGSPGGPGETNNTTFKSIQFDYKVPDLQVTSTGAPPEVETDTAFALEWTTANTGNKGTGNFDDRVYFSTDNQVGSDVLIGTFPLTGGLAEAATVNRIQNVSIPTSAILTTGNYWIYVLTDGGTTINEGVNENNNTRFHLVNVRRLLRPDLTITNITGPPTVFFDQTVQVQWTVTNTGQGPTNTPQWTDRLYIGTSPTSLAGATTLKTTQSVSALNPGESYTASAIVKIPRGFNGGYHFLVKTDSNGNLNEENINNNQSSTPVQVNVPPLPDLIVETVQAPDEVFAGQDISINYTVRNIGTNSATSRRDQIYFSRDTLLNPNQDRLVFTSDNVSSPAAGQSQAYISRRLISSDNIPLYQFARVPSDMQGLWYVFVIADYTDSIYEFTGENNNTNYDRVEPGSPINVLVSPPDLVFPNMPTAPATVASGTSFPVAFTVRNQGAFNAAPNLYHGVYLSTDQTFNADSDTLIGSFRDADFFGAGGEHPISINVRLPDCLSNGTYYLFAVADYNRNQFEFDPGFDAEANNASPARSIQLSTVSPDLRVTSFVVPPITMPGQSLSISWTVSNLGGATTANVSDRVYIVSTNPGIGVQTISSFTRSGGLSAGASYTETRTVSLPAYMDGEYYLLVTTDVNKFVPECGTSEDNNSARSSNFTVQNNLPDLVIDTVIAPATAVVGGSFNVQWTGRNANQAMPDSASSWADGVYLSTNPTYSNDDYYIGSAINNSILSGGQTYSKQTQVATGNIPSGTYHILVYADSRSNIYEGTNISLPEYNNVRASSAITLTTPAVDLQVGNVTVAEPYHSGTFRNFSWTVTNAGASQTLTANWTDSVILSRDSVIDASDITLGFKGRSTALAGGASYTQTANFFVPTGLTGDYTVFVITDRNNNVVESNNLNNTSAPVSINLTLPPPAELSITNITPPASISLGGNATFAWTVQNTGANAINGKWRDTVYLSRDQFWDATDTLVGVRDLDSQTTSVPANGGTYSPAVNFQIPPVEEGSYYVIVRTDSQNRIRESNEGNNVTTSVGTTTVTITELQLNTPFNTTLGNGAQQFFKYVTDPNETLVFSLTTDKPARSNEAFTKFDTMVSRADYDFFSTRPGEGNQENVITNTQEGDYYSMVRTDFIPESFANNFDQAPAKTADDKSQLGLPVDPQNITVNARILPFSIRNVSPEVSGNAGYATIVVEGAKFQEGATMKLVRAGSPDVVPAQQRTLAIKNKIVGLFDLKGKAAGEYDVVVTNPNSQTAILEDGFEIISGGGAAEPRITINGPGFSRGGRNRYTISVANDGLNDLYLVPIMITMPSQFAYELDRSNLITDFSEYLPPDAIPSQLPTHYEKDGIRIIPLFTPVLGSKRTVNINIDVILPFGFTGFEVTAFAMPPLEDWYGLARSAQEEFVNRQIANISTPNKCEGKWNACMAEVLRSIFFNLLSELMPGGCIGEAYKAVVGLTDYVIGIVVKGEDAGIWDAVGGTASMLMGALGGLAEHCLLEVIPWFKTVSAIVTVFKLLLDFYQCYKQYIECLAPPPVVFSTSFPFSIDPNEKIGPKGYGGEKFVPVGQPLEYRINFENLSSATAPAQLLRITDSLPPPLDLRTVRLKEIGFKQNRFVLPPNQSFYQNRVQLGEDLGNIQADILAGVDLVNNRIFWNIQAIDPNTSEAPLDPFAGILPPNNANRDGEGYVIFTVEAKTSFPNRTMISNSATITFDQNEPIITNATENLLDSVIPTSQIAPLPATSEVPEFQLSWSGTDDSDGSGFAGHNILFSEDSGGYLPYLSTAIDTTTSFTGRWGKSYRFYSVGRDNAGNIERAPEQPDATIRIRGGDTEADVAPRPDGNDGVLAMDDTAQIRRFIAKLDTVLQYNEFQRADTATKADGGDGSLTVADIMQARRYVDGLDAEAEASGPNSHTNAMRKTIAGKSANLLPREIRPIMIVRQGNQIEVGILMETQGDETGLAFGLNFNPAVLSNPTFNLRPVAAGSSLTVNTAQAATGKIGIMLDKVPNQPFPAGSNVLMTIMFDIAMGSPATTQITIGNDPLIKEVVNGTADSLATTFSPGTIALLGPTASNVSVSGRVLAANGTPIKNARLVLAGTISGRQLALTNGFGYFRFDNVTSGQTYTLNVSARGYVFVPCIITVSDEISDMEIFPSIE